LLSRNRSTCGVRSYVRATCNPCPADDLVGGWLANFLSWWIADDGYADLSRAGKRRWMVRINEEIIWANHKEELDGKYMTDSGEPIEPKSVTFIPATIYDNPILMQSDRGYIANLMALPKVDRERLLGDRERGGNWKVRATAGMFFHRDWFRILQSAPQGYRKVRFWDMAATAPSGKNTDPDWTVGALVGTKDGDVVIFDIQRVRARPFEVDQLLVQTAAIDGADTTIVIEQEPGSSGVAIIEHYKKLIGYGYHFIAERATGAQENRVKPFSHYCEAGLVSLVAGDWNHPFITESENYPAGGHDDQVVAASGGVNNVMTPQGWAEILPG
ncbi:MAG: terminase, partial [Candidatus Omnitrophota bacterium]